MYLNVREGDSVQVRVYKHGFWTGTEHEERIIAEDVLMPVEFKGQALGSSTTVFYKGRGWVLSRDDDGKFCIVI